MEDLVLIRKCLAGQTQAFEPLVAKYKNLVYSIALNTLNNKNDAADATQEVFLKVWTNLPKFDAAYTFKAWIARITVNHCLNMNQKDKRLVSWNEEEAARLVSEDNTPEDAALIREKQDTVRAAIRSLPEMYRVVIDLYHQQCLSYEEICMVTGQPMSIVKNRLYRGRKMLAEKLSPYYDKAFDKEEKLWIAIGHGT